MGESRVLRGEPGPSWPHSSPAVGAASRVRPALPLPSWSWPQLAPSNKGQQGAPVLPTARAGKQRPEGLKARLASLRPLSVLGLGCSFPPRPTSRSFLPRRQRGHPRPLPARHLSGRAPRWRSPRARCSRPARRGPGGRAGRGGWERPAPPSPSGPAGEGGGGQPSWLTRLY